MDRKPLLESSDSDDDRSLRPKPKTLTRHTTKLTKEVFTIQFSELSKLVKVGNYHKVKDALKKPKIQLSDFYGTTILHVAVASDNVDVTKLLLSYQSCLKLLNSQDIQGVTPLMAALNSGSLNTLELLCARGADLSIPTVNSGETVLHLAARRFDTEAARILLTYNSTSEFINFLDSRGDTALVDATRLMSPVFDVILKAGADISTQNPENGRTILHVATAYNRISVLTELLQHPDATLDFVEIEDVLGMTALMIAVKLQKYEIVEKLTSTFQNLSQINHKLQESALHSAILNDRLDILTLLLSSLSCSSIEYYDAEHRTPLLFAAELDRASCLQELVENGADIYVRNPNTNATILHVVAEKHSNSTLPILMSMAHISWFFMQKDSYGNTPYMSAVKSGNDVFLRESFKVKKIDLCEYNSEGETTTYYTIKQGFPKVLMALLLSPKYYSFSKSNQGVNDPDTILKAEIRGDIYATDVYILLKQVVKCPLIPWFPPNLLMRTKLRRTVFHACALGGSLECLEFLYEFYSLFCSKYLLDDFDIPGLYGNTPLLFAARCGRSSVSCAFFFATHGANLTARNSEGVSVIQAIFQLNPEAATFYKSLFNSCVSAEKEIYFSDRVNIKVDFSILCPEGVNQSQVICQLYKYCTESEKYKILQHPVIVVFLKQKLKRLRRMLYFRFIGSCIITICTSVLIPALYIVEKNPDDIYGPFWTMIMRLVFIALVALAGFQLFLKVPAIVNNDLWISDVVAFLPPTSMIALITIGKSSFLSPELAAIAILSSWVCVLVFCINVYSNFSYQIAVFFRLLHSIYKQLVVLGVIILAFASSFFCIYNDEKRFSHFPTTLLYTSTVLLHGQMTDLPTFKKDYFTSTPTKFHFFIECFILGSFVVIAVIGFVNMLVGLAVRGGRHLEENGKIFQSHHESHYISGIEYWYRNRVYFWLSKQKLFAFLKKGKANTKIHPILKVYEKEDKSICDEGLVRQLRSIVFRRIKGEQTVENKNARKESKLRGDDDWFGNLPGATKNKTYRMVNKRVSGMHRYIRDNQ